MNVSAEAPSNIALIKYMGKTPGNMPTNPSLSFTLKKYLSQVEIEKISDATGVSAKWEWLGTGEPLKMSPKAQDRFLGHFQFLCDHFNLSGEYIVRSANSFPAACGVASSASSYAALTQAVANMAWQSNGIKLSAGELGRLSRKGSGSSCRSFFSPWALWMGEGAEAVPLKAQNLSHALIVVDTNEKDVSSSEAHLRVSSSLNFTGRAERATQRLRELIAALNEIDWQRAYEISWAEFWDMHSLFETSSPSFGYMTKDSLKTLNLVRAFWQRNHDGPIVTMDAGPNVHLLFREDQQALREALLKEISASGLRIWGVSK